MKITGYEKIGLSEQMEYACPQRWRPFDSDFRLNAFGIHEIMPPVEVNRPEGTGDWLFILFHDDGWVVFSDGLRKVPSGSLVCWERGAMHHYGQEIGNWDHTWIHFDGSWAGERLKECGIEGNFILELQQPMAMETCLWRLYAELTNHHQPDPIILKNLFHIFLRQLRRDICEGPSSYVPEKIRGIKQYLDQHACHPITLRSLAEKARMSVPHLCAEFRRCYNDSPINYVIGLRLEQARYLLLDPKLSVDEIASRVGYNDPCHFSKLFKKHFRVSPGAVRNMRYS